MVVESYGKGSSCMGSSSTIALSPLIEKTSLPMPVSSSLPLLAQQSTASSSSTLSGNRLGVGRTTRGPVDDEPEEPGRERPLPMPLPPLAVMAPVVDVVAPRANGADGLRPRTTEPMQRCLRCHFKHTRLKSFVTHLGNDPKMGLWFWLWTQRCTF